MWVTCSCGIPISFAFSFKPAVTPTLLSVDPSMQDRWERHTTIKGYQEFSFCTADIV